ncbi:MAG: ABC transporter substrate-binding protein [Actinomycetes bacterium]
MARPNRKFVATLASLAALTLALSACSGDAPTGGAPETIDTSQASGEVSYWLWDSNQQPAYQKCADAFQQANPNVTVQITQYGWGDYWTNLTNGFVAGTAPDVFTNHVSRYPEFVAQEQLLALDETLAQDNIPTDIYQEGLAELWVGQDGKRYALPKDFDTVAIFYNKSLVQDAGVTEAELRDMTWNPDDGGSYERIIARLTVDNNGVRGDEPGFDKNNVAVYGLGMDGGAGGPSGQTQWSMYSGTTGWTHTDKNPWGSRYNYDDPRFQATVAWWKGLIDKGYMPTLAAVTGQGSSDIFAAGKYAMLTNGSWMTNQMFSYASVETGLAPTPKGPGGERASMLNGLGDSVWIGSDNKAAAVKWVEFLGSPTCQNVVGQDAVVLPAIPSATDAAIAAWEGKGIDVSAFTVHVEEGTTHQWPITDRASEITNIMNPAMDAVISGSADVTSLTTANEQVNALLG